MVRQGHPGLKVGYMVPLHIVKCIVNLVYFIYYIKFILVTMQVTEGFMDFKDLKVC